MKKTFLEKFKLHKRTDTKAPYSSITFVFDNTGSINHCKIDKTVIADKSRIDELKTIIANM